jgi:hypothetical protein
MQEQIDDQNKIYLFVMVNIFCKYIGSEICKMNMF